MIDIFPLMNQKVDITINSLNWKSFMKDPRRKNLLECVIFLL